MRTPTLIFLFAALANLNGCNASPELDHYAILPVAGDFPPGWRISSYDAPGYSGRSGKTRKLGRVPNTWKSKELHSIGPSDIRRPVTARVTTLVIPNRQAAVLLPLELEHVAIMTYEGSYSGKRIGDRCFRASQSKIGYYQHLLNDAALYVGRGPVLISVGMSHPSRYADVTDDTESLALTIVGRTDSAIALAESARLTVTVAGRNVQARMPNGIRVVHMDEYATATGAAFRLDMLGGTAELARNGRILKVNIGRREGWLNGQANTLRFPALRHGASQVYCPLETLAKL